MGADGGVGAWSSLACHLKGRRRVSSSCQESIHTPQAESTLYVVINQSVPPFSESVFTPMVASSPVTPESQSILPMSEPVVAEPLRIEVGEVLLDDFVVEPRRLGEGGIGAVFLVRSRSGGQRFAVKMILPSSFHDENSRRNFLNELLTWIDLPEHPHLAACRFFRTIGGEVVVFAEYVEGG